MENTLEFSQCLNTDLLYQFCRLSYSRWTHSDKDCSVTVQPMCDHVQGVGLTTSCSCFSDLKSPSADGLWDAHKCPCLLGSHLVDSPPLSVGGSCDLLLTSRIWQQGHHSWDQITEEQNPILLADFQLFPACNLWWRKQLGWKHLCFKKLKSAPYQHPAED